MKAPLVHDQDSEPLALALIEVAFVAPFIEFNHDAEPMALILGEASDILKISVIYHPSFTDPLFL